MLKIENACRTMTVRGFVFVAAAFCVCDDTLAQEKSNPVPLFSFGVIADIQYADKDTAGRRHYRDAVGQLDQCVADLNTRELAFTIQLGDFIDGHAGDSARTHADLDRVLSVWGKLKMAKYHVVGNHCLVAGQETLQQKLGLKPFYYDFTVPDVRGWRFIVLDGNDAGYGVLGEEQLQWFESKLAQASRDSERVIVFNHFALLPAAAKHHRMKTPEPVLKLMDESGCVVAYLAGHDHAGGYAVRNGVHHITVKGMVEAPTENAYAVVEVYEDRLREIGCGKEPTRDLQLENRVSASGER